MNRFQVITTGLRDWADTQGAIWLFVFKALLSAFVGLWLAYRLEMPQPTTVLATVFIVLQRNTGDILAKSFYRIIGSLVGLSVMIVLIALFNQERVFFLLLLAIWIGLCVAGAGRYRDFRSYACILAGYTAVMIGIPAAQHPDDAFMQALWRVVEIIVGILVTGWVNGIFFPQTSAVALRRTQRRSFRDFCSFMLLSLPMKLTRGDREQKTAVFFRQAALLDNLLAASAFEDPKIRVRRGRLARMNQAYMGMNSRLHSLLQLLERCRPSAELQHDSHYYLYQAIGQCWECFEAPVRLMSLAELHDDEAGPLALDLRDCQLRLKEQIRYERQQLSSDIHSNSLRRDFDTAAELLYRLLDDICDYVVTQESLLFHQHEREGFRERFHPHASRMLTMVSGLRCTGVLLLLSAFWLATAWDSGDFFVLTAGLVAGLVSVAVNPVRLGLQILLGTLATGVVGFILQFYIFPMVDGFEFLCLTLTPVFGFGAYLLSRPTTLGYGVGWCVWFCILSLPVNQTRYLPYQFLNNWLAAMLAMIAVVTAVSLILPPDSPWSWRRLESDLKQQLIRAIRSPFPGLESRIESAVRDLLTQSFLLAERSAETQGYLMRWAYTVTEASQAILNLRVQQAEFIRASHPLNTPLWQDSLQTMLASLVKLIEHSNHPIYQKNAVEAVNQCITLAEQQLEKESTHFSDSPVRRVLSYLHLLRTVILDPMSSFRQEIPVSMRLGSSQHAT